MIIKKMYEYVFSSEAVFCFAVLNHFIWTVIMKIHIQEFCCENWLPTPNALVVF